MNNLNSYRTFTWVTLLAVYCLILIGSTVRASGAGMGCPDWPTCFGQWIPPMSESDLPENYQIIYADLGYANEKFNVVKTWTEYLNRLFGVTVGLLIFILFLLSFKFRREYPSLFYISFINVVLVAFQGWLGSQVVASNLFPGLITLHMMMAVLILLLVAYSLGRCQIEKNVDYLLINYSTKTYYIAIATLFLTLIQTAMGTQVREMIDYANQGNIDRDLWVNILTGLFYIHRSFSWLLLLLNGYLLWQLQLIAGQYHPHFKLQAIILIFIILQIGSGAVLNYLAIPAFVQPLHLLIATVIIGMQFNLVQKLHQQKRFSNFINAH